MSTLYALKQNFSEELHYGLCMSLRRTAYVASQTPCSKTQSRKVVVFSLKVHFQCAAKFLCVKTITSKDLKYSLA